MKFHQITMIIAIVAEAGCEGPTTASPGPAVAESPTPKAPSARKARGARWEDELAQIDSTISFWKEKAERSSTDFLALDTVAGAYLQRARLTGSYDDYAAAEETLAVAFQRSPTGGGPIGTQAALDFTLHRLDRVGPALDQLSLLPTGIRPREGALLMRRGNLALQKGEYVVARDLLQKAVAEAPDFDRLSSLAQYHLKTGDFDTAKRLYQDALGKWHGNTAEPAAWLHLQLGLLELDRGRWPEALAHYRDAEAELSGWYLIEEHIAEVTHLLGKPDEALAMYSKIVERTNNPEFMDAIASIHKEAGRDTESKEWISKADAEFEKQLARFPEAAYGHALDHFLDFGTDTARTVELAEANHRIRPNGEAKTKLAQAYLLASRVDDARKMIDEALASDHRSADTFAVAAETRSRGRDEAGAEDLRAKAKAINPHALD